MERKGKEGGIKFLPEGGKKGGQKERSKE